MTAVTSIDVIVACHGHGRFLAECVRSVLAQDVARLRVLIIDDASPDETSLVASQLARGDGRVSVRRHAVSRGHVRTCNEGLDWAAADALLLLSADDCLLPGALGRALQLLSAHPKVGFVFGNYRLRLHDDSIQAAPDLREDGYATCMSGRHYLELSGARNPVCTATAVVRTQVQRRLGGYVGGLPHAFDMEMWMRIASHADVGFIAEPQTVRRRHAENMSTPRLAGQPLLDLERRRACLDTYFHGPGLPAWAADPRWRGRFYAALATDAVHAASAAFDDDDAEASEKCRALALDLSSAVRQTVAWRKLALKRAIGSTAWHAVQPLRVRGWRIAARSDGVRGAGSRWRLALLQALRKAQRWNVVLPRAVATPLRHALARWTPAHDAVTGLPVWDLPLGAKAAPVTGADASAPAAPAPARWTGVTAPSTPPRNAGALGILSTGASTCRCLLVTSSLDVGGMDEVVAFLARHLPRRGVHTAVLHAIDDGAPGSGPGWLARVLAADGIETVRLGPDAGRRFIETWRPDVISAHDPAAWVLEAAATRGTPYVETLHGMHTLFGTDWAGKPCAHAGSPRWWR